MSRVTIRRVERGPTGAVVWHLSGECPGCILLWNGPGSRLRFGLSSRSSLTTVDHPSASDHYDSFKSASRAVRAFLAAGDASRDPSKKKKRVSRPASGHENAYSIAVSEGYPYMAGSHSHRGVVYNHFTKNAERTGPRLYVGYDHKTKRWILEHESAGDPGKKRFPRHLGPKTRAKVSRKVRLLRHEGYPAKQAVAIAYRMSGVATKKTRRRGR